MSGGGEEPACPCCGGRRRRLLYDFTRPAAGADARSERIPGRIVACLDCGLQYKLIAQDAGPLAAYYADQSVYEFRDDEAEAEKEFRQLLTILAQAADGDAAGGEGGGGGGRKLLDVGCGPGRFLASAKRAGYQPTGVELNAGLAELARRESGAEVLAGAAEDLPRLLADREKTFDAVTLLDVIEHVPDPVGLLRLAARQLAPDGVLLVYTPNHSSLIARVAAAAHRLTGGRVDGPARGIYDCDHIVFFDPATLTDAVRRAGLRPLATRMIKFNPDRRRIATGPAATALRLIEAASPYIGGEFRIALAARL